MVFKKGNTPWNKNLTKENSEILRKTAKKISKTQKKLYKEGKLKSKRLEIDEKEIIRLYTEENKTCKQIGKVLNCDLTLIYRRLKNNNINTSLKGRPKSEEHIKNLTKPKSVPNKNKGKTYEEIYGKEKGEEIANKNPLRLKFTLEQEREIIRLYKKELLESREIEKLFNCGEKPIFRILKNYNINTKNSHRLKLLMEAGKILRTNSGSFGKLDKHPNWVGGTSFEPYGIEFNKKLKKLILERDGCCMVCKVGFEDLKLLKKQVCVHHINYDKQCNLLQNLISLCNSCHAKTNFDRKHYTKFFQSLLAEMYDYKYSEKQEVILNINQGGG